MDGLDVARAALRAEQGGGRGPDVTDEALVRFAELTRVVEDPPTGRWRRGAFTYVPEFEADRIRRGEDLIRRVQPGPAEDPNYFALLAYQAASIELVQSGGRGFDHFLLGTIHAPQVNAFAQHLEAAGHTIVALNSGLVDFVYQAAKCVIEAIRPRVNEPGKRGLVVADAALDTVRANLAADPAPADRLYATLAAYFFDGYPRASSAELVPLVEQPPLSMTVGFAERWIIAHEYGHGLAVEYMPPAPSGIDPRHHEEFFGDAAATIVTVLSADRLDAVPPEFALAGAIFVLAALDVLDQALYLLLTGEPRPHDGATPTHPAPRERTRRVIATFRARFDVIREPSYTTVRPRTEPPGPGPHSFTATDESRAYRHAHVLHEIWNLVRSPLLADRRAGRSLHPMWR